MAKAAGYDVLALDIFADTDTASLAQQVFRLPYVDGGFEPAGFEAALSAIAGQHEVQGLVYGSGFERNSHLLSIASRYLPVLGNSADIVAKAKAVPDFSRLLDTLDIPYPPSTINMPVSIGGWLRKRIGGSGGTHVCRLQAGSIHCDGDYYQQELAGTPVSVLFAADSKHACVVGYNRQEVSAWGDLPFRYGGLVTHASLPDDCRQVLQSAAEKLTAALQLRGLNSLDAILMPEGRTFVLELNPRLTASAGLYRPHADLMCMHLDGCRGAQKQLQVEQQATAQLVVYAESDFTVPPDWPWPEWVADMPEADSSIMAGDPVCTVWARAESAETARTLARQRLQMMVAMQQAASNTDQATVCRY